jgi:ribosome-associated heat shock protein Hsp15
MNDSDDDDQTGASARIDRWLWRARFYKSRALASRAVAGGKVHVNGERVKPARRIAPGDRLNITQGPQALELVVLALPPRRGPSAEAQRCYEETPASIARREKLREQHALAAAFAPRPETRPHKRERRQLLKLRRQQ